MTPTNLITSAQNSRIKNIVHLRQRSHRDADGLMIIEGFRELKRALDNQYRPVELYFCPELFQGTNEPGLMAQCREAGALLFECSRPVFEKIGYRDRPEGLLALGPQIRRSLNDLSLPPNPLLIVAEAIEKPGNLGTILRSADAAGVQALIVCDRCTDLNNPNVVRASIGTLFSVPVAEASSPDTLAWLRARNIRILAATPHAEADYFDVDLSGPVAIVVGAEQYGLSDLWMREADLKVRIPMLGQADSLNVSSATTLLLYEAVRQRRPPSSSASK